MFAAGKPHQEQGKAGALGRPVPQKAPGMLHDGRSNPDAREMIATLRLREAQKAAYVLAWTQNKTAPGWEAVVLRAGERAWRRYPALSKWKVIIGRFFGFVLILIPIGEIEALSRL
jgi:hypothetical protein